MNTQSFLESAKNEESWPSCPTCRSREMGFSGPYAACLDCLFTGSVQPFMEESPVLVYAKMKTLAGANGIFTSLQFGSRRQVSQKEVENRRVRALQLNALSYVSPIIAEVCLAAFEGHLSYPHVILIPEIGAFSRRTVIEIDDPTKLKVARVQGASADISCHLQRIGDHTIEMTVNVFGIPSFVMIAPVTESLSPGFIPEVSHREVDPARCFVNQPIAWEIIPFVPGVIYPRYVGTIMVPGALNVTLAVCENMDGDPLVRSISRMPTNPMEYALKSYPITDSEEAVEQMKGKLAALREQLSDQVSHSIERSWDLDIEIPEIIGDLTVREEAMWVKEVAARGGALFR